MKVIKLSKSLVIDDIFSLKEGHSYVCSDYIIKQIMRGHSLSMGNIEEIDKYYHKYDGQDLTNKKLLVWRSGGIGDLLFITPTLQYIKDTYPGVQIRVACSSKYLDLWHRHPLIFDGHAFPMPFDLDLMLWADYHLHFEGAIETGGRAEYIHAVDLFSEYFNLADCIATEKRRPIVPDCDELDNKMRNILKYTMGIDVSKKIILVQFRASAPIRTFPERRTMEIAIRLAEPGRNVIIVDHPNSASRINDYLKLMDNPPGIFNGAAHVRNIRETIALIKKSALLIAPDSSLTHIAGAINIDIPTLAIYGPFPSKVRTAYYPKCVAIDAYYKPNGSKGCAGTPCFTHGHDACIEAKRLGTGVESPCFSNIKNKTILYLAERILEVA